MPLKLPVVHVNWRSADADLAESEMHGKFKLNRTNSLSAARKLLSRTRRVSSTDEDVTKDGAADKENLVIVRKTSVPDQLDMVQVLDCNANPIKQYLDSQTCYDLLPNRSSFVCLDSSIKIYWVCLHMPTLPAMIWDSTALRYTGVFTEFDYIRLLRNCLKMSSYEKIIDLVHETTLAEWFSTRPNHTDTELVRVTIDEKPTEAVAKFGRNRVRHLPVFETAGDLVGILTPMDIVQTLRGRLKVLAPSNRWFHEPLYKAKIVQWGCPDRVRLTSPLTEAMERLFVDRQTSVPVVSGKGALLDALEHADVVALLADFANEPTTAVLAAFAELTVGQALDRRLEERKAFVAPAVASGCQVSRAGLRFAASRHARLYVVDEQRHLLGAVALNDYLAFLISQTDDAPPPAKPSTA